MAKIELADFISEVRTMLERPEWTRDDISWLYQAMTDHSEYFRELPSSDFALMEQRINDCGVKLSHDFTENVTPLINDLQRDRRNELEQMGHSFFGFLALCAWIKLFICD